MCDVAVEGFRFEAAAACNVDLITPFMAVFTHYADLSPISESSVSLSRATGPSETAAILI